MSEEVKYFETATRSIVKTVTHRVVFTISHILNGLIVTGSLMAGLELAGLSAITSSFIYWAHERLWNRIQFHKSQDEKLTFNEKHTRSIVKLISWRFFIFGNMMFLGWIVTGSWGQGAAFASIAVVVNSILLYIYDRVWNRIKWGKIEQRIEDPELNK